MRLLHLLFVQFLTVVSASSLYSYFWGWGSKPKEEAPPPRVSVLDNSRSLQQGSQLARHPSQSSTKPISIPGRGGSGQDQRSGSSYNSDEYGSFSRRSSASSFSPSDFYAENVSRQFQINLLIFVV